MKFIFFFLFSMNLFALESSDKLNSQILKVYDKNVLVLNRGLEDGIIKSDHGKLTSSDGFIARGICIKTSMQTSHWKIYRVVRAGLISKDSTYTLSSINQSEIPYSFKKFQSVDFSKYYTDFADPQRTKQLKLQQEKIAKYDLPDKIITSDLHTQKKPGNLSKFIKKNFSDKTLKEDLSSTSLELFASPLSFQTRYDQKETHYGLRLYNRGEKYRYELSLLKSDKKIVDEVSKQSFESSASEYELNMEVYKLTESFSAISLISYEQEKIGEIYYPKDHYIVGVLGFRFHFIEEKSQDKLFDISYIPAFDNIKFSDPETLNLKEREGIRHHFKLRIHGNINSRLMNKTQIIYSPLVELSSSNFNYEDTYVEVNSKFSYKLSEKFFFDYIVKLEQDNLRAEVYDIDQENITQSLRLRLMSEL